MPRNRRVSRARNYPHLVGLGEPGRGNPILTAPFVDDFATWLATQYGGNLTALQVAWQYPYRNISQDEFTNFSQVRGGLQGTLCSGELSPWPPPAAGRGAALCADGGHLVPVGVLRRGRVLGLQALPRLDGFPGKGGGVGETSAAHSRSVPHLPPCNAPATAGRPPVRRPDAPGRRGPYV